ncbi:D-2-hydroxyacid dehydrogenase [Neobacillus dielmonensis]|uniref:D-2-hydroxyacid dehydrogenase n=1 Tax=Neobacillus dielmonensis TaxID=1347369 RepID=UPI0005A6C8B8|nr:D-2-hydroxyacid dehydrogenase [Neobacillus dielmonensis]
MATLKQPNILVFHPKQAKAYADYIRLHGFSEVTEAATYEEAKQHLPNTEIILGWKFPTELLRQQYGSSVRWFQSIGAGVDDLVKDNLIPANILLTRIIDQFGPAISEYVFTYLLYLVKNVQRMIQAQQNRQWDPFVSESLAGKTIGVAGLGSIGAEIVRKARAFDMTIHGLSLSGKHTSLVDRHFDSGDWTEFVKDLDYLVLTLPLTNDTFHIINKDILSAMKPSACLINVGRGALINEDDLITVLQPGQLQTAVLDVFETEPLPADHPFYSLPNVYITSHLSGPSTVEGVGKFFVENLHQYINDQPLAGLVDRERGY